MINEVFGGAAQAVTWVTKAELAAHLRCTTRYVTELMRRQVLPYTKERGFVRFNLAACDQALARRRATRFLERAHLQAQPAGDAPTPRAQRALEPGESRVFATATAARRFLEEIEAGPQGGAESSPLLVVVARLP
jgi:hypothetical protein